MQVPDEHAERIRLLLAGTLRLLDETGPHIQCHSPLERVTVRESAAQRRDRDARAPRDLIQRSLDTSLDERIARRGQDPIAVAASIGAQSSQACIFRLAQSPCLRGHDARSNTGKDQITPRPMAAATAAME